MKKSRFLENHTVKIFEETEADLKVSTICPKRFVVWLVHSRRGHRDQDAIRFHNYSVVRDIGIGLDGSREVRSKILSRSISKGN